MSNNEAASEGVALALGDEIATFEPARPVRARPALVTAIVLGVVAALLAFSVAGAIDLAWGMIGAERPPSEVAGDFGAFFRLGAPVLMLLGCAVAALPLAGGRFAGVARAAPFVAGVIFLVGGAGEIFAFGLSLPSVLPAILATFAAAFAFDARVFPEPRTRAFAIVTGVLAVGFLALFLVWAIGVPAPARARLFNPRPLLGVDLDAPQLLALHLVFLLPLLFLANARVMTWIRNVLAILSVVAPILYVLNQPVWLFAGRQTEQTVAFELGVVLAFIFLTWNIRGKMTDRPRSSGVVFAVLALVTCLYLMFAWAILLRLSPISPPTTGPIRVLLGIIVIAVVVEGVRRVLGVTLAIVVLVFLAFDLWGQHLDVSFAPFDTADRSWDWVAVFNGADRSGVFGDALRIGVIVVIPFVLFGKLLALSGGSEFFTNLATAAMGRFRGGAGKITVVGSALFGMVSGSAVANVAAVGSVSIPLMKRTGFQAHVAGATEAAGSTAGQLMPPVMGAAAFLMAEILEIPYSEVIRAAVVPIILYYGALFIAIDLYAARRGLKGIPKAEQPPLTPELKAGWHFLLPFVVFLVALLEFDQNPETASLYAILALVITVTIFGYHGRRLSPGLLWRALVETGQAAVEIVIVTAAAGIVVGVLFHTGSTTLLGQALVEIAGGNLFPLLVIAGILSIILGMGMPTVSVYLLLAFLIAPALVDAQALNLGMTSAELQTADPAAYDEMRISAHLFVQYFGLMSMVTPPIAVAAFAAATIARTSFWKVGWTAVGLGWTAYVVPFIFVYQPDMLLGSSLFSGLLLALSTAAGILFISFAVFGYARVRISIAERVLCALAGAMMMVPEGTFTGSTVIVWIGVALAVALAAKFFVLDPRRDRGRAAAATPA